MYYNVSFLFGLKRLNFFFFICLKILPYEIKLSSVMFLNTFDVKCLINDFKLIYDNHNKNYKIIKIKLKIQLIYSKWKQDGTENTATQRSYTLEELHNQDNLKVIVTS